MGGGVSNAYTPPPLPQFEGESSLTRVLQEQSTPKGEMGGHLQLTSTPGNFHKGKETAAHRHSSRERKMDSEVEKFTPPVTPNPMAAGASRSKRPLGMKGSKQAEWRMGCGIQMGAVDPKTHGLWRQLPCGVRKPEAARLSTLPTPATAEKSYVDDRKLVVGRGAMPCCTGRYRFGTFS